MKNKLIPTARINKRYLLLDCSKETAEKIILDYIGILGWAKATPQFIPSSNKVILSVDRKSLNDVRAAFELSTQNTKILKVSGTLKGID